MTLQAGCSSASGGVSAAAKSRANICLRAETGDRRHVAVAGIIWRKPFAQRVRDGHAGPKNSDGAKMTSDESSQINCLISQLFMALKDEYFGFLATGPKPYKRLVCNQRFRQASHPHMAARWYDTVIRRKGSFNENMRKQRSHHDPEDWLDMELIRELVFDELVKINNPNDQVWGIRGMSMSSNEIAKMSLEVALAHTEEVHDVEVHDVEAPVEFANSIRLLHQREFL